MSLEKIARQNRYKRPEEEEGLLVACFRKGDSSKVPNLFELFAIINLL